MRSIFKGTDTIFLLSLFLFFSTETHSLSFEYINQTDQDSLYTIQLDSLRDNFNSSSFEYSKALRLALTIHESLKNSNNVQLKFRALILLGDIYDRTNNFKESLKYFKSAYQYLDPQSSDFKGLSNFNAATATLRLGYIYAKTNQLDSAKYYYLKVDDVNSFSKQVLYLKALSFNNLSGIYEREKQFDIAEDYSNKALALHRQMGDKISIANALNNLGNLYLSQGLFQKSKDIYEKGIGTIENDNSEKAIRSKADLYYNLAWAMRNLKEYKAYDALEDSYDLTDRIRDINLRQIIEEIRAKHNVDLVKKEAEIEAAKASRKFWFIVGTSLILIIILSFLLYSYRLRQRNLALEIKRKVSEQERKLSELKAESQSLILNAALDGKESERREIAETLHDNVSTLLSSASLHLQACKTQFNGKTPEEVQKTQIIINEASQKIRDLSHTLVSSILLKFGLSFAVNDIIKKYSNSQIKIKGTVDNLPRFDQRFEIKVYNIIQELVNNILKHSEATEAHIKLQRKPDSLLIEISDNGKGFDKKKISIKDGMGINQIDARIHMMEGSFNIQSEIKKGTSISIELPTSNLAIAKSD